MTDDDACSRAHRALMKACEDRPELEEAAEKLRGIINIGRVSGMNLNIRPRDDGDCSDIWAEKTQLADFDGQKESPWDVVIREVCISPLSFLQLQFGAGAIVWGESPPSTFFAQVEDRLEKRPDRFVDMIHQIEDGTGVIPMPVAELDTDGRVRSFQEGRHRAAVAFLAGYDTMPAWLALNTGRDDGAVVADVPTQFEIQGYLEQELQPLYDEIVV